MSQRRFRMPEPGKFAKLFPVFLAIVPTLTVLGALVLASHQRPGFAPHLYLLCAVFPLIAAVLAWSWHDWAVVIVDDRLVFGRLPWRRLRIADLDLAQARVVDLGQALPLQPVWKIAGTRIPGLHSGWFRLRGGQRAFARLTDWKRVVVLPRRNGQLYLFSVEHPDALLDALRAKMR